MKNLIIVLALLSMFNCLAQNESISQKYFSKSNSKSLDGYFTIVIDTFSVVEDGYLLNVSLYATDKENRIYNWRITGPKIDTTFSQLDDTSVIRLRIPFAPESHFFWQEHKRYSVKLFLIDRPDRSVRFNSPTIRKIKFNVVKSGRRNFGNDIAYQVTQLSLTKTF